jgi:hypothetical protein
MLATTGLQLTCHTAHREDGPFGRPLSPGSTIGKTILAGAGAAYEDFHVSESLLFHNQPGKKHAIRSYIAEPRQHRLLFAMPRKSTHTD